MLELQADDLRALPAKLWKAGREISRRWIFGANDHPISRLSPEILGEIFMRCLCTDGFPSVLDPPRLALEPLGLSQVSAEWRQVTLSTPSLWSTLWIDRPQEAHIPMVQLWLERSRACPLVLYLRQTAPLVAGQQSFAHPNEYELADEILLLLGAHLHRWKRITFLFYKDTQEALLNLPENVTAAPLLEHVQLSVKSWEPNEGAMMERILYSYSSVNSVVIHPYVSQEFICWSRLVALDAKQLPCPINSYLHVFRHCPLLQRAEIRCAENGVNARYVPPPRRGRLRLPHLSSFTIHADRVDLRSLFDALILPALEGLVLRYSGSPRRAGDPQALWRLLTCSACVLTRFSLREADQNQDDAHILSFLSSPQMAALKKLYLQVDLTEKIVHFLTLSSVDDATPGMLVNLNTISLLDLQGDHIDDLALYRMVVSRLASPPARSVLRNAFFSLRLKGHWNSALLPWLVERCRGRIDLRIFLAQCEDRDAKVGWYTSAPIAGGYLADD
ncbi:hypothetical protein FB45DRAFT_517928 [Roridomyces roridus]|uniref:F-box domain-containing protein n=1 Tax=Roridomyces roridus TaxID=1738132 RepID=A0AAD7BX88_9AGAR|nr:hypothetical protein FB45DRAFT_517928 [Roridomyces roridus]